MSNIIIIKPITAPTVRYAFVQSFQINAKRKAQIKYNIIILRKYPAIYVAHFYILPIMVKNTS